VFDFGDVVEGITAKMIRRHPHVFGTEDVTAEQFSASGMAKGTWERIKAEEKAEAVQKRAERGLPPKNVGVSLDGVPAALPGLSAAVKLQQKASKVGFDWNDPHAVLDKIVEETGELREELGPGDKNHLQEEIGDLLFAVANLARHLEIDPEAAIRSANLKFRRRFQYIEDNVGNAGETLLSASLDQMEALWQQANKEGI